MWLGNQQAHALRAHKAHILPGLTSGRCKINSAPKQLQGSDSRQKGLAVQSVAEPAAHAGVTRAPGKGMHPDTLWWPGLLTCPSGRFPRWKQPAASTSSAAIYEYFNSHKKCITSTLHSWLCGAARGTCTSYIISLKNCNNHWFWTNLFGSLSFWMYLIIHRTIMISYVFL